MAVCGNNAFRWMFLAVLAPVLAACNTTGPSSSGSKSSQMPISQSSTSGRFLTPVKQVDPELSEPCIVAAANKYFLPVHVIRAVDTRSGASGGTDVVMQVDLRSAVCQVSSSGVVRNVIDTTPMSADQAAAEAAAKEKANKAAPAKPKAGASQDTKPKA